MIEFELVTYRDERDRSALEEWLRRQETTVQSRLTSALFRLRDGNTSSTKSLGRGLHELRLFFGPGYRVYFAKDGERIILLFGGGTKQRQAKDIEAARDAWERYKQRKAKQSE